MKALFDFGGEKRGFDDGVSDSMNIVWTLHSQGEDVGMIWGLGENATLRTVANTARKMLCEAYDVALRGEGTRGLHQACLDVWEAVGTSPDAEKDYTVLEVGFISE